MTYQEVKTIEAIETLKKMLADIDNPDMTVILMDKDDLWYVIECADNLKRIFEKAK